MFKKFLLLHRLSSFLKKNEFEVAFCEGCFDLAARNDLFLLLKVLLNVDGLAKEMAMSLKAVSYFVSAFPLIISLRTNHGRLKDGVVYSRFGISVLTPTTFKNFIREELHYCFSSKGKHLVKIDVKKLKEQRKRLNYSLSRLSRILNISKKSLYKIEKGECLPRIETAKKLEKILKVKLMLPFQVEKVEKVVIRPRSSLEERVMGKLEQIGIENSPIHSAPFNLIGREKFLIISKVSRKVKLTRKIKLMKEVSSVFSSKPLIVVERKKVRELNGIPVLEERELSEIGSSKELVELLT